MPEENLFKHNLMNGIATDVKSAEAYADLGYLQSQQDQWQAAIANYRHAIELNPDCSWFYHHLADIFLKQEQWQEAIIHYRQAIKLNPDFSWSYHNLGNALLKSQSWEAAIQAYRKAIQLNPQFHWSYGNLGDALVQQKQWDLAIIQYWNSLVILHQTNQEQDFAILAPKLGETLEYHLPGTINLAIAYYQKIIQNHQQYPEYHTIISFLNYYRESWIKIADFFQNKHWNNAALILYSMVIEVAPDDRIIAEKINRIFQKRNNLEQTIRSQHETIQKNSQKWSQYDDAIIQNSTFHSYYPVNQTKGQFLFSTDIDFDLNQLDQLFEAVGWMKRDHEQMKLALEHSFLVVTLWSIKDKRKQLIGFTRAVSDHIYNATLWDVVIHPHFQSQGLGKTLIQYTLEQLRQQNIENITLFAGSKAVDFYHHLGFITDPNGIKGMFWVAP